MQIARVKHKGLKALYEHNDESGLPANAVAKIRRMLTALEYADDLSQIATLPGWKLHPLKGGRKGSYSLVVTRNWRLTFMIDAGHITDIDFEDYH